MKKLLLIVSLLSVGGAFAMQEQDQALAQRMVGFVSDELREPARKYPQEEAVRQAKDLEFAREHNKIVRNNRLSSLRFTSQSTKDAMIRNATVQAREGLSEIDRLNQETENIINEYHKFSFIRRPLGETPEGCFVACAGTGTAVGGALMFTLALLAGKPFTREAAQVVTAGMSLGFVAGSVPGLLVAAVFGDI